MSDSPDPTEPDSYAADVAKETAATGKRIVAMLRLPPHALTVPQAALVTAHLIIDLGESAVAKLDTKGLDAAIAAVQKGTPITWSALKSGNAMRVVHAQNAHQKKAPVMRELQELAALVRP